MKITELSKKKAVPSRQRDPGALATRSHIASQEKRHADWAEKQRELQKQFYANHPELADTKGTTEGSVNKKPQPYNDPNWIKNLPKEKLDALAGPRYTKRPKKNKAEPGVTEGLNEFAPPGSNDGGDDGFSEETLKRLAAQWYNGDEDPRAEQTLAAAGWEIGWDEGYDDEPGVFVVQTGDENGNSYISWPAHELKQGLAEAGPFSYGKAPRKGSVADLAAKKRREQEKGKQPIEPKDQQVGVAKVTKGVAEVSDATLTSYLTKVDADARKHPSDPTKRPAQKRNKSVAGFSRAFNKLDARKAQELAPRVGESTEEDKARYEQAARDVVKGADPDHIARVRKLDPELLRQHVAYAWEKVNRGDYKLNRPNLEETDLQAVVNAQQGGMPLADVSEACWDTHRQQGMKKKGDRMVPNCVPKESMEEARESCPECGGPMFPALILGEKQDACYYKVKSRYKVWPSAYASGALVQCRKKGAANWGNKGK